MKLVQQILLVFTGIIYFISSTGVVVYKTNCSCFGNEQVSVYVTPETCDTEIHQHQHHQHDNHNNTISCCEHECHECGDSEDGCGCQSPETYFFKLVNPLVNEEILFVKAQPIETLVIYSAVFQIFTFETDNISEIHENTGPPPVKTSSLDFLIPIHQLKIPLLA
jgi:hypothetical protein